MSSRRGQVYSYAPILLPFALGNGATAAALYGALDAGMGGARGVAKLNLDLQFGPPRRRKRPRRDVEKGGEPMQQRGSATAEFALYRLLLTWPLLSARWPDVPLDSDGGARRAVD